jgi:hypothetical protein
MESSQSGVRDESLPRLSAQSKAELGNFFEVLAASLAHAREQEGKSDSPSARREKQSVALSGGRSRSSRRLGILLACLVGAILLEAAPSLFQSSPIPLPAALVGRWRTSAPRYADRTLRLSPVAVTFEAGGGTELQYPIDQVRMHQDDKGTVYVIDYLSEGKRCQLSLRYQSGSPETIQFVNQPDLEWQKVEASAG